MNGSGIGFIIADEISKEALRDYLCAARLNATMVREHRVPDILVSCSCTDVKLLNEVEERDTSTSYSLSLAFEEVKAIDRHYEIDARTCDPHSSYYIPLYFSIFGSTRPVREKRIGLPVRKVQKNVRPKGTHTHWKFYR